MTPLSDIIGQLESASDPVDVLRCLVLEDGGDWPVALEPDWQQLVEIQSGVTGFGFGEVAATQNWVDNARRNAEGEGRFPRIRCVADHAASGEGVSSIL